MYRKNTLREFYYRVEQKEFYKNNASFMAQKVGEKKSVTRKQDIIVQAVILVYPFLVSIPTLYPGLYITNRVFRDELSTFLR